MFVKDILYQVSVAIAGTLPVLAFLAIPAVEHAGEDLAVEEVEKEVELCLSDDDSGDMALMEESGSSFGANQVAALSLFLLWKLMMGVAITTYWTLGVAYMVDAISPLTVPAALGRVLNLNMGNLSSMQAPAMWPPTLVASLATSLPQPASASTPGGWDFQSCPFAMLSPQSCL